MNAADHDLIVHGLKQAQGLFPLSKPGHLNLILGYGLEINARTKSSPGPGNDDRPNIFALGQSLAYSMKLFHKASIRSIHNLGSVKNNASNGRGLFQKDASHCPLLLLNVSFIKRIVYNMLY